MGESGQGVWRRTRWRHTEGMKGRQAYGACGAWGRVQRIVGVGPAPHVMHGPCTAHATHSIRYIMPLIACPSTAPYCDPSILRFLPHCVCRLTARPPSTPQALSHHLMGAGRLDQLRRLLMNPGWLEAKLHAYGIGAVVRDFRRWADSRGIHTWGNVGGGRMARTVLGRWCGTSGGGRTAGAYIPGATWVAEQWHVRYWGDGARLQEVGAGRQGQRGYKHLDGTSSGRKGVARSKPND